MVECRAMARVAVGREHFVTSGAERRVVACPIPEVAPVMRTLLGSVAVCPVSFGGPGCRAGQAAGRQDEADR